MVMVGGELTLSALELAYSPTMGFYSAPVQAIANGGVLVIDDFGRQHCSPRDLLNRWIVPLESRMDFLTLQTGQKFHLPFMVLVVFATNIKPAELVDEAFLRRIHYKVFAESPTRADFLRIFSDCCRQRSLDYDQVLVERLLDEYFQPKRITCAAVTRAISSSRRSPRRTTWASRVTSPIRSWRLRARATSSTTPNSRHSTPDHHRRISGDRDRRCAGERCRQRQRSYPPFASPRRWDGPDSTAVSDRRPRDRTEKAPAPTVRFYVNGELLATDSDGAPYVAEWEDLNPFEACALSVEADFGDTRSPATRSR
jgi:hypothetical protein